jgi:uncharacterized iron-regulated membrane protein
MHAALLIFHRWLALVVTVLILVIALTGSALVFEGAMDRGLHPQLWRVTPRDAPMSLDTLLSRARALSPKAPITGVTLPPATDRSVMMQAGATQIFVDPYTGVVKGTRTIEEWNRTLPRRLHVMHVSLMASKVGGEIVGVGTIAALILVLTGAVLWWRDKLWRIRWSASWKRILFDLHHTLGVFAAIILVIIATSGLFIHYESLNKLMARMNQSPPQLPPHQSKPTGSISPISVYSLYRVAVASLPGARVMFLTLPPKPDVPFLAAMRFPEDRTPGGRSRVYVDRFQGIVLGVTSTRRAELGTRLSNSIRSIHTGDVFGRPTEAIWLAAAIILATQGITGVAMWWNGRASRAALARAAGARRVSPDRSETALIR